MPEKEREHILSTMTDHEQESLRVAIESLHGCRASFRSAEVCKEFGEDPSATREVATFVLDGHSSARLAYAWFDLTDRKTHHRVVLHTGGITSARHALKGFRLFHTGESGP